MTLYKNNQPAITNPDWSKTITIPSGDSFDGTLSTTDPLSARVGPSTGDANYDKYYSSWPWSDGFLVKPSADITTGLTAVMYQDYYMNEKRGVSTGTPVTKTLVGQVWNEDRIIELINGTGSDLTIEIGA